MDMTFTKDTMVFLVVLLFGSANTAIVSVKTESYGCSRVGTSKIIVNGTDYLEGSDGINLVSIKPGDGLNNSDFHNVYAVSSDSQVVAKLLQSKLDEMLTEEGTVFVLSIRSTCFDGYNGWYEVVTSHPGLVTDPGVQWVSNTSAAVIIGCYKRCPVKIAGQQFPVIELGDEDDEIYIDVVFNTGELQPKDKVAAPSSSKKTIIIIIVIVVVVLLVLLLITLLCCWKKRRANGRRRSSWIICGSTCCCKTKKSIDMTGDSDNRLTTSQQLDHHELNRHLLENKESPMPQSTFQNKECTYYDPASPNNNKNDLAVRVDELYEPMNDNKPLLDKNNSSTTKPSNTTHTKETKQEKRYQDVHTRKPVQLPEINVVNDHDNENDHLDYEPVSSPIYKTPSNASSIIYKTPSNASSTGPIYKSPSNVSSGSSIYKSPSNAADSKASSLEPIFKTPLNASSVGPIYKTPSNASSVGPIYKTPSNASSESPIYKSPSNASSNGSGATPIYKSPSNASDPIYKSPSDTTCTEANSGYQVPKKKYQDVHSRAAVTNNNSSLPPQNQNINTLDGLPPQQPQGVETRTIGNNEDSAIYTNVEKEDDSNNTIYKTPSNIPSQQAGGVDSGGGDFDDHDYELPGVASNSDEDQIYQNFKQLR